MYCLNDPVNLTDFLGAIAGELFTTIMKLRKVGDGIILGFQSIPTLSLDQLFMLFMIIKKI